MNILDFYTLSSKLASRTLQAHIISPLDAKNKFHELSEGHYEGIEFPVVFKHAYGNRLDDILDTGTVSLFLISDKLYNILKNEKFTGWKTFEMKLIDKKGLEIPGYHGLSITGQCGEIDFNKSETFEKRAVPNGPLHKYLRGLHIGIDKWDGSDFCHPKGTLHLIVTKRVMYVLKVQKITNVRFENLSEYEMISWDE